MMVFDFNCLPNSRPLWPVVNLAWEETDTIPMSSNHSDETEPLKLNSIGRETNGDISWFSRL